MQSLGNEINIVINKAEQIAKLYDHIVINAFNLALKFNNREEKLVIVDIKIGNNTVKFLNAKAIYSPITSSKQVVEGKIYNLLILYKYGLAIYNFLTCVFMKVLLEFTVCLVLVNVITGLFLTVNDKEVACTCP